MKLLEKIICLILLLLAIQVYAQIPKTMSYQGVLTNSDNSAVRDGDYLLVFRLYDAAERGQLLWEEKQSVSVSEGVFSVILGSQTPIDITFDKPLWLELELSEDGQVFAPRTALTTSPYSFHAESVADGSILGSNIASGQVLRKLIIDSDSPIPFSDSLTIQPGQNVSFDIDDETRNLIISANSGTNGSGDAWRLNGNAGTDSSDFIGTTDRSPLQFKVNDRQVLRIEPTESLEGPNIIAGSSVNSVDEGVVGATISGGGDPFDLIRANPNRVIARFGTVGGGAANIAGHDATVAGGFSNSATGPQSTVSGGVGNIASGIFSSVPGGSSNQARGQNSFAAGQAARAAHDGAFVWSDSNADSLVSTSKDQFLIGAAGGVGININAPSSPLTVAGVIESTTGGFKFPDGSVQTSAASGNAGAGDGHSLDASDGNPKDAVFVNSAGNVGIGTTQPKSRLHVEGGSDVTPGSGAYITVGDLANSNIAIDNNEIMARRNGGAVSLTLNADGGEIILGGPNGGNIGIGTTNPQTKLDVRGNTSVSGNFEADGNATISGEVRRSATGSANMVPICYGNISSDGKINRGTGNFSVKVLSNNSYEITIDNESIFFEDYIVMVTPAGEPAPTSYSSIAGKLLIKIGGTFGSILRTFSFIVYKV